MSSSPSELTALERRVVRLIAAVQFVNILDFVMVMPLGPQFARALHFPESRTGMLAGAYTGAAAISGLIGSFFLDRFDRKKALTVALCGLSVGTLAGVFAWDFTSLMAARVLAGVFGGPATSLAFSIIADTVPPERRGKAMGLVMGAFGAASVLGIPLSILLGAKLRWWLPFLCVAALGSATVVFAVTRLPSLRGHLVHNVGSAWQGLSALFADRLVWLSYLMTFAVMLSGFIVIPNISAYVQNNLGEGAIELLVIYLAGGICSFVLTPVAGRLIDRHGSFKVGTVGTGLFICVVAVDFIWSPQGLPVIPSFIAFFIAMAPRNVAYNTLTTKVPRPELRARFMSIQSAVQHSASALGGFLSAAMLTTSAASPPRLHADGTPVTLLVGMPRVAWTAIALACTLPILIGSVEASVRRRARRA